VENQKANGKNQKAKVKKRGLMSVFTFAFCFHAASTVHFWFLVSEL